MNGKNYICNQICLYMISLKYPLLVSFLISTTFTISAKDKVKKDKRAKKNDYTYVLQTEPDKICSKPQKALIAHAPKELKIRPVKNIHAQYREGIDVSHYQGDIDWNIVVKNANISYAYLKATEGATLVDDTYEKNLREAKNAGLLVGSYHFYRPNTDWKAQFENLTKNVRPNDQDLVPIIDIEHKGNVSDKKFIEDLTAFVQEVRKYYGAKPLLYTFQNFYNKHLVGTFPDYHWMIAKYKTEKPQLNDNKQYIIWQYTAKGKMQGIKGNGDRSRIMDGFQISQIAM